MFSPYIREGMQAGLTLELLTFQNTIGYVLSKAGTFGTQKEEIIVQNEYKMRPVILMDFDHKYDYCKIVLLSID